MAELQEIIGSKYKKIYLKKIQVRIRNRIKPLEVRQPTVALLETEDRRKFKILQAKSSKNIHLQQIKENMPLFAQLEFVSKILWADARTILIEFIEGEFPDIESKEFAEAYAENLAQVHDLAVKAIPFEIFQNDIQKDLELFVTNNFMDQQGADRVIARLRSLAPSQVRTSLVYADQNRTNFVISPENKLFFIDLGSFQSERATDEFVLGGVLFERVDQNIFRDTYLAAGGSKFIFDNSEFLRAANLIRNGAGHLRRYLEVPFFDWRLKRARLGNINRSVKLLTATIS